MKSRLGAAVLALSIFAGGLSAGVAAGRAAAVRAQRPYASLAVLGEVLGTVERDYVEPVETEALVDAAVRGLVSELDVHSRWLDDQQIRAIRDEADGSTAGLGIELSSGDGGLQIVEVAPDSPAARDGLAPGDRVVAVDGRPIGDVASARAQISGAEGQVTSVTVLREGWDAPRTFTAAQDRVARSAVRAALVDERVVYARVALFQEGTAAELRGEVERLAAAVGGLGGLRGLVVDLRDNPGGLLSEAVATTDLFLDEGPIVTTRLRDGAIDAEYRATPGGLPAALPVVLVVNGMSASASEIVASALQDTGRALLVGEQTYGKGTVQQVYLPGLAEEGARRVSAVPPTAQSALKLTVGRYYTPSGAPVAAREGRMPDRVVPYPREPGPRAQVLERVAALERPEDRAELAALVEAMEPDAPARARIAWDRPVSELVREDPQVRAAVEALPR